MPARFLKRCGVGASLCLLQLLMLAFAVQHPSYRDVISRCGMLGITEVRNPENSRIM